MIQKTSKQTSHSNPSRELLCAQPRMMASGTHVHPNEEVLGFISYGL